MEVLYEVRGRNLLIYLPEELDHHNAKIITEQSDWYIISNKIQNIIFNFKRTKFMDSSGIGVIMGRYKLVKNRGGKVTVTNINNSIDRILTISGLYKIVEKTILIIPIDIIHIVSIAININFRRFFNISISFPSFYRLFAIFDSS